MAYRTPQDMKQELWRSLKGTLQIAGFEPEDFEMALGSPPDLGHLLSRSDQLLTVRRRSTGHRQCYAVAPGCPWLFTAFADLTAGRFGACPRPRQRLA